MSERDEGWEIRLVREALERRKEVLEGLIAEAKAALGILEDA